MVPQKPRREGPRGTPCFRQPSQRRGIGARGQTLQIRHGPGQGDVSGGKHIRSLQGEQEVDFRRPGPQPFDRGDRAYDSRVVQPREGFRVQGAVLKRQRQCPCVLKSLS